ncbi:MAG: dTMP kinase [Armatimonadetes bacterium]|nr:dTMP kinase [Armatimonadota bacterium]
MIHAPGGLFITVEGADGTGKTTHAGLLADRLRKEGRDTILTREPGGGGAVASALRELLLHGDDMADRTELLLFFAARSEHVAHVIRPAINSGSIVVCDRYTDSTLAYQGYGLNIPLEMIYRLHEIATGDLWPDLTILLDLDPAESADRLHDHNRMEGRGMEFQHRVRNGFLSLAETAADRYVIVPSSGPMEEVHAAVWDAVRARLPLQQTGCAGS